MRIILLILLVVATAFTLNAQDLEVGTIKKSNGIKLSGGLALNTVYNTPVVGGGQPLSYFVSGIVNFNVYGYNIPVSINYSNRKFGFSQPYSFNQISFNPSYKWISAHIGMSAMTFSPHSLNGHQFKGAGVDLSPKNWKISAMAGQLIKGQSSDTLFGPTYRRFGYGLKTSYSIKDIRLGITYFQADDKANSLSLTQTQFKDKIISPKSNTVLGFTFGATILKAFQLEAEYTNSLVTANSTLEGDVGIKKTLAGFLHKGNASTESFDAFKSRLNYNIKRTQTLIGFGYERVDPNYQTLGGYYFVNDFENFTTNLNQALWKGKLNLGANLGVQRDDLNSSKSSSQRRFVGAFQANFAPNPKLNIGADYSNFRSFTYIRTVFDDIKQINPFEQLDTLNFTQLSQNLNSNLNYRIINKETLNSSINLNFSVMAAADKQGDLIRVGSASNFYNGTIGFVSQYPKKAFGYNVGVNMSKNTIGRNDITTFGPIFSIQKAFNKNKIMTNASFAYLNSKTPETTFDIVNLRANANYAINKNNQLTSNIGYSLNDNRNFGSITFGYSYKF
jgi:hypothetical protein